MKITICITYYNQKKYIKASLDSVLSIEFPCEYEVLCGDDGSNDGTLDIIKTYAEKYPNIIRYFITSRTEKQKSISRASANRLNLVKHASGDYIMFLDGDDFYCDKDFVKEALNIFKNVPNIAVCAFNFKYLYPNNAIEDISQQIPEGIVTSKTYISNTMYTHAGACIFKNILDKDKLKQLCKINNFDDNAITIYFLQYGNLYFINKPIYTYRQTYDSIWNSANDCEKHIINAFDYKLISEVAPRFRFQLLMRQKFDLKYAYWNRKHIKELLGNSYNKYVEQAKNNKDTFIENILLWDNISANKKLLTALKWLIIKGVLYVNDKIFRFI